MTAKREHTLTFTNEELEAISSSISYVAALIGLRSASDEVRAWALPDLTSTIQVMVKAWEHQVSPDEGLFATINAKCRTTLGLPITRTDRTASGSSVTGQREGGST